jgi:putative photosynthetic complex assembly protein 2
MFFRYGLPVLYTLFLWWFSTGVIIFLDGLPRRTFGWTFAGASLLFVLSLGGLHAEVNDLSRAGAYCSFTGGVIAWGWIEVGFLMGPLTGPRKHPCPPGSAGWERFGFALQAILYHEFAILAAAALIAWFTYDAGNQVGLWAFVVLWAMRMSAKFNIFLGVRNLGESFLPDHLLYLSSYFRRRTMNLLFPLCVTAATAVVVVMVHRAIAPGISDFEAAANTFVATMLALAVLEHWLLVVPLPETALWRWSLVSHSGEPEVVNHTTTMGSKLVVPIPAVPVPVTASARHAILMPAQRRWQ